MQSLHEQLVRKYDAISLHFRIRYPSGIVNAALPLLRMFRTNYAMLQDLDCELRHFIPDFTWERWDAECQAAAEKRLRRKKSREPIGKYRPRFGGLPTKIIREKAIEAWDRKGKGDRKKIVQYPMGNPFPVWNHSGNEYVIGIFVEQHDNGHVSIEFQQEGEKL